MSTATPVEQQQQSFEQMQSRILAGDEAAAVALKVLLAEYDQHHVLRYWDELDDAQRVAFAKQILAIDLERLDRLVSGDVATCDVQDLADRISPPPARRLGEDGPVESAVRVGTEALKCGLFGVVIVAGGQGSRLGFPHPKGMYPVGPVADTTLFQILIEKIRAVAEKSGVQIPLYLMTSPATHAQTVQFLADNDRFGLAEEDLFVFCQGTMPAVDESTGKLLLADKGSLFLSPDGHGGMLTALDESGAMDDLRERGIEHLFYCQVDNALVDLLNPEFLGYHILANSDVTTQVIAKHDPTEKVGNVVSVDGRLQIIEYSDLPQELAERQNSDGSLELWAGNIAVHAFSMAFLEEAGRGDAQLPCHVARKKIPHINDAGELVKPDKPNGVKFEQFIFDLLPLARRSLVIEVDETETYAPLKNADGKDSPEYVKDRMVAEFQRWFTKAGQPLDKQTRVEISPLVASSPTELGSQKLNQPVDASADWYVTK